MIMSKKIPLTGAEVNRRDFMKLFTSEQLESIQKDIKSKVKKMKNENKVENYLEEMARNLEPKTHCCECTPGKYYDVPHFVHIQYFECKCNPAKYILKRN